MQGHPFRGFGAALVPTGKGWDRAWNFSSLLIKASDCVTENLAFVVGKRT